MGTKGKHKLKFNKEQIIQIGLIFGLLLFVAGATVLILNIFRHPVINDEYFVSDDSKSVISMDVGESTATSGDLVKTFFVYTYDGDNVSGLKTYFEYTDKETAQKAYEARKDQPEFKGADVDGKYVVVTADAEQFKGLTADDIRQQTEAIEQYQKAQKSKQTVEAGETEPSGDGSGEGGEVGPGEEVEK